MKTIYNREAIIVTDKYANISRIWGGYVFS